VDGSRLVFVIEDDDGVRASTRALLESSGFSVRTFSSAEELLDAGSARDAGCLVLDQHLPGISGIELLESLRADGHHTPAIMVTSNGTQFGARAASAGVTVVLRKPLTGEALEDWLKRLLPDPH
jgi:FixJ family two-component response regulator